MNMYVGRGRSHCLCKTSLCIIQLVYASPVCARMHTHTYTHTLTPHTHTYTIVSCVKHNPHTDELVNKCPHPHIPFHIHTIKPAVPEPNQMHNAFSSSPSSPFFSLSLVLSLTLCSCAYTSVLSCNPHPPLFLSVTHHGAPLPMETDVGSFSDWLEVHFLLSFPPSPCALLLLLYSLYLSIHYLPNAS